MVRRVADGVRRRAARWQLRQRRLGQGRPVVMMLSAGQMNGQKGANILAPLLPPARDLIADRGYDSNPFRAALAERGIAACIPPKKNRKAQIPYDKALYRQRYRIEIAFGRLKDWRRIATRYDRCATTFLGAITLAAIVIFWLGQ
jgi:transposase